MLRRLKKERRARKKFQEKIENPSSVVEPVKNVTETASSPQSIKNCNGNGKRSLSLEGWMVDGFMVFNATFNNISVISWRSVLFVEETGVPGENH
jgi:hypothetical protein